MANAVTFWKGTKANFDSKVKALGRIYFVTDDDNNGSLYLGVQGETAVEARLISPARLTALTAEITDNLSTVTAKAVVDFVKSQIEAAFGAGSAYATKIAEIEGDIDDVEGRLDVVEPKVTAIEGILAGFGGEEEPATVAEAIQSVKDIASAAMEFKGVKATVAELPAEAENGDIYYVTADDTEYVYIADKTVAEGDSKWEALGGYVKADVYTKSETDNLLSGKVDVSTYNGKVEAIEGRLDATEGVANGAAAAVATKVEQEAYNTKMGELDQSITDLNNNKVNKTTTVNGKTLDANITLTGEDINVSTAEGAVTVKAAIEDRYTKEEIDDIIDGITGGEGSLSGKMDKVGEGKEGQVITADATGNSVASGYTLGGAALAETTSDKVLATEKAVEAAATAAKDAAIGDADSKLANKVDNTITVNGKALSANVTIAAADIEDVYSKTEVENLISGATLVWQDEVEA